jgi:hypothetical protein
MQLNAQRQIRCSSKRKNEAVQKVLTTSEYQWHKHKKKLEAALFGQPLNIGSKHTAAP